MSRRDAIRPPRGFVPITAEQTIAILALSLEVLAAQAANDRREPPAPVMPRLPKKLILTRRA